MNPRNGGAADDARLYAEAARLTEEFCARVRRGDDDGGETFNREREAILGRIRSIGAPPEVSPGDPGEMERHWAESARAIRRILELDRELIELLEARRVRVREKIDAIQLGRQSLRSYRGPAAMSAAFLDRVG